MEVISQQKEQLARYETRLKDVVRAYKGLAKEKETLESSLKAITAAVDEEKAVEEVEKQQATTDTEYETDNESIAESAASEAASAASAGSRPKAKLAALSNSLAAVTAEKAQNEARYLADKRKLRKEREELSAEVARLTASEAEVKVNLEETKSCLIIEKHEREKEIVNNQLMVQELQKLVGTERAEKEKLSEELLEMKSKIILLDDPSKNKKIESQVEKLREELEATRERLRSKDKQLREQNQTEARLAGMAGELQEVKARHLEQLKQAESAREQAELRALEMQGQQEKRVVNLETRLQELSASVCQYEQLRTTDQRNISSMRQELETLQHENTSLTRSSPAQQELEPGEAEGGERVWHLLDKVTAYKAVLLQSEHVELNRLVEVFQLPGQTDYRQRCGQLEGELEQLQRQTSLATTTVSPGKSEEFLLHSAQEQQLRQARATEQELRDRVAVLRQRVGELGTELGERQAGMLQMQVTDRDTLPHT